MTEFIDAIPEIWGGIWPLFVMVFVWGIISGAVTYSTHGLGVAILDVAFLWCEGFGCLFSFFLVSYYHNGWYFLLGALIFTVPLYGVIHFWFPEYMPTLLKMIKYPMIWMLKK